MKPQTIHAALVAAIALLAFTSCKEDPIDPLPEPLPQQQLPNPLPANALVKQIKWAETDFIAFNYNDQNQVTKVHNQWQYVQGDPTKIRTIVHDFQYDAQHRPVQVTFGNGLTIKYAYNGNLIAGTQEFNANGKLLNDNTYLYKNGIIVGYLNKASNAPGEDPTVYKYVFGYDNRLNLNKIEVFQELNDGNGGKKLEFRQRTEYTDFDNNINPDNWMILSPYLPQIRWQRNNPREETLTFGNGIPQSIYYAYTYNALGLPVTKSKSTEGGILTAQYSY